MGYQNNIISQPVSIHDVQQPCWVKLQREVDGETQTMYSDDESVLCSVSVGDRVDADDNLGSWNVVDRGEINFWSARKPVYSSKITPLTEADWSGYAHELVGYKTGGGIKKVALTGTQFVSTIGTNGDPDSALWTPDKPVLYDGICYKRLTDFAGYWHTASNMFHIYTIFGQIDSLPVPSNSSDPGQDVYFEVGFRPINGTIIPAELFGDCHTGSGVNVENYYLGVVLACSSAYGIYYVKTADTPVNLANEWTTQTWKINTKTFMDEMISDYTASHTVADPYAVAPFISGTNWTATIVLISNKKTGEEGFKHKLNIGDTVVRLEYENNVDRRTLPLLQKKYTKFEWMKLEYTLHKLTNQSGVVYKITDVYIHTNKLTSDSVTLTLGADLSVYLGTVNVPNVGSGSSVSVTTFSNGPLTLTGTGEMRSQMLVVDHSYTVTGTSVGNEQCNATFYVKEGTNVLFRGGFSIDVYQGRDNYSGEITLV